MPRRTRRLSPAGLQLHGNLHTLGYFSADVCVGTPARTFDLIVDTGSSLTAFPCEDCSHCGAHMHGTQRGARFSDAASSSSELCHLGSCSYSTVFTEGSSIRGRIIFDSFWLGSAQLPELSENESRRPVRAAFGCQTYESGLFFEQEADGIIGFSQHSQHGGTLFDYIRREVRRCIYMHALLDLLTSMMPLRVARTADAELLWHSPNVFSICLSAEVGALVMGGSIPSTLEAGWIPFTGGDAYLLSLVEMRVAGRSIASGAPHYGETIIDSGTTFIYLPPSIYRVVKVEWQRHCPWGACASRTAAGDFENDYCYSASEYEVRRFAQLSLHFDGVFANPDANELPSWYANAALITDCPALTACLSNAGCASAHGQQAISIEQSFLKKIDGVAPGVIALVASVASFCVCAVVVLLLRDLLKYRRLQVV
ncbi:MAG: hypothetical protein SGPRY_007267 [Prymnesium sp.]